MFGQVSAVNHVDFFHRFPTGMQGSIVATLALNGSCWAFLAPTQPMKNEGWMAISLINKIKGLKNIDQFFDI